MPSARTAAWVTSRKLMGQSTTSFAGRNVDQPRRDSRGEPHTFLPSSSAYSSSA
jgi:hypothetical protein